MTTAHEWRAWVLENKLRTVLSLWAVGITGSLAYQVGGIARAPRPPPFAAARHDNRPFLLRRRLVRSRHL